MFLNVSHISSVKKKSRLPWKHGVTMCYLVPANLFSPGSAKDTPHLLSICAKAERFMAEDMLLRISYIVPWIFLGCGCGPQG